MPVVIALNKVDRLKGGHIAEQMKAASRLGDFHALHPVSAKTGDSPSCGPSSSGFCRRGRSTSRSEQRTDLTVEAQIGELSAKRRSG